MAALLTSCATVPQESVQLSALVEARIAAVRASHEAFVADYFRISRERVEDFLQYRWMPHFLGAFVTDAALQDELEKPFTDEELSRIRAEVERASLPRLSEDELVRAIGRAVHGDRKGQIVLEFATAALAEIENQRRALLDPLDRLEARALQGLRVAYAELEASQRSVTAHLRSVRDVTVEQDRLLRELGVLEERDAVVRGAVALNESVQATIATGREVRATLEELVALLEGTP